MLVAVHGLPEVGNRNGAARPPALAGGVGSEVRADHLELGRVDAVLGADVEAKGGGDLSVGREVSRLLKRLDALEVAFAKAGLLRVKGQEGLGIPSAGALPGRDFEDAGVHGPKPEDPSHHRARGTRLRVRGAQVLVEKAAALAVERRYTPTVE
jgi:hypothetical protein